LITYSILNKYTDIAHFCTTRNGGISVGNYASNNMSPFSGDEMTHYSYNQKKLIEKFGSDCQQIVLPFQTHGTDIREIDNEYLSLAKDLKVDYLNGVDAIFTQLTNYALV